MENSIGLLNTVRSLIKCLNQLNMLALFPIEERSEHNIATQCHVVRIHGMYFYYILWLSLNWYPNAFIHGLTHHRT